MKNKAMAVNSYKGWQSLEEKELPLPVLNNYDILIRNRAASINPADVKVLNGEAKFLHGRKFPLVAGYDFSGVVEKTGPKVTRFKEGDEVFGHLHYSGRTAEGSFAQYVKAHETMAAAKPDELPDFTAAASATVAATAYKALFEKAALSENHKVLITGASGGVGSMAVQFGDRAGSEVIAYGNEKHIEALKNLGATEVIDYRKNKLSDMKNGFDIIFDAAAVTHPKEVKHLMNKNAVYVTTLPSAPYFKNKISSWFSSYRTAMVIVDPLGDRMSTIGSMLKEKKLTVPVYKTFKLHELKDAFETYTSESIAGKIAIEID